MSDTSERHLAIISSKDTFHPGLFENCSECVANVGVPLAKNHVADAISGALAEGYDPTDAVWELLKESGLV